MPKGKYKKEAWLLDDKIFIHGIYVKGRFYPNNHGCGFSCQKIWKKNIGRILFLKKDEVLKTNFEIID